MNKTARKILCAVLSLAVVGSCSILGLSGGRKQQNVILFIGDGMGDNHIANAKTYFELDKQVFEDYRNCSVRTRSENSPVTDSAAAATAMATGKRVSNGNVGCMGNLDYTLTNISELAKSAGYKVGIVTTDYLSGATPAGFSAHAVNRSDEEVIAASQAESNIDLFIGGAQSGFVYYNEYGTLFEDNGYTFVTTPEDLEANADADKLIATLPEIGSKYIAGNESDYQLVDMLEFAMEFLSDSGNGYFLMVEGAWIDKYSHNTQLIPALCEARSLFDAVEFAYDTVGENTAVFLTADHETGNLSLATDKGNITDALYGNEGNHTNADVSLFVKNFKASPSRFRDNTDVFKFCKSALGI